MPWINKTVKCMHMCIKGNMQHAIKHTCIIWQGAYSYDFFFFEVGNESLSVKIVLIIQSTKYIQKVPILKLYLQRLKWNLNFLQNSHPCHSAHLFQRFFHWLKCNCNCIIVVLSMSFMSSNFFLMNFQSKKQEKSNWTRSGDCGKCCTCAVRCFTKKLLT